MVRKSDVTRQRILDSAALVFSEKGYAGARLADIAAAAGMQAGSLYYHFPGRDELVEEVLRQGVARTHGSVRQAVEALPEKASALDRVRAAIAAHVRAVLQIGDYTSANIRIFGQVPDDIRARHLVDQRSYGAYWNGLLEAARAAGDIRADADLSVVRMLILGAANWSAEWYRPEGASSPDDVAEELVRMVCDGLAAPTGKRPAAGRPAAPAASGESGRGPARSGRR
ncbi:MAG TPA: TetR/AcrR family transcriptional regulator [Acidimicrobiia bacterium]|nr:TetR/AcrR family transcriptional regulator [Acidimicrobiia bacterium]